MLSSPCPQTDLVLPNHLAGADDPTADIYSAERTLMLRDWYHTENGALAMGLNRCVLP